MKVTILTTLTTEEITTINQELSDENVANFWLYDNSPLAGHRADGLWWWQTTAGNSVSAEVLADGTCRVVIDATRHSLHDTGNVAGAAMELLGLITQDGNATDRAKAAKVEAYDSLRDDCPWWDWSLDHPAVVAYRRKARAAGREVPSRLIFQDGAVRPDWHEDPVPGWDGIEYRRAAANGVAL